MTACEVEYMTDEEIVYCRDCKFFAVHCANNTFKCTNDGSDHYGHVLTEDHLACDPDYFHEKENNHGSSTKQPGQEEA